MPRSVRHRSVRSSLGALLVLGLIFGLSSALAGPVAAADGPKMDARALFQGHARVGSWLAIEVRLQNDGAPIVGELRLQGGAQGGTRFSLPIDLASPADKTFLLYAQPPSFGQQLEVILISGGQTIARQKVAFTVHDANQLIVGVVAARPQGLVGQLQLPANQNGVAPVTVPLTPADLPDRIEAWSALDRLVWQDVDTNTLRKEQISALRGWLALGGRLVIVGGTAGSSVLSGFPDAILPYRPSTTDDVAAASLTSLLGVLPASAADVPGLAGSLDHGRALATTGDRVVAAEAPYGSGSVTLIGFDPTVGWIAESKSSQLWRSLLPPRTSTATGIGDDSQILSAVQQLPALDLPPLGGLLLLLLGYIILIGPINYLVLRRLDKREWAWITMPILIAVFAIGAYAFGSALRGSDIIVNEVAIVRGAPDATEGSAQVYLGIFSPTRGTYQVALPGGALVSAPIVGDLFGGQVAALDVVQGPTARVRDLSVGFGSLRTVRAETPVDVPKLHADLQLVDGVLQGKLRNDSDVVLESPAVVLGGSVAVLKDLAPGAEAIVSLKLSSFLNGQGLSDKVIGQVFYTGSANETQRRIATRHQIVDQLTYDPAFGGTLGSLPADVPVVLAWGRKSVVDVEVTGQRPTNSANVLYYIPVSMSIRGTTVFQPDLMRSTVLASDAMFFSKDPNAINFGQGSVTVAYRPIAFNGTFTVSKVHLSLGFGGDVVPARGQPVGPLPPECVPVDAGVAKPLPTDCPAPLPADQFDGIPEVEVFDRTGDGAWRRLPHMQGGSTFDLDHPDRYVDPTSGTIQIRFVNDRQDSIGVPFQVSLEGTIR